MASFAGLQPEYALNFRFSCLAVFHTSGRVTLTPLELDDLAVHAETLEQARFELTLSLDDKIGRAHPRHLWKYCRPGQATLLELPVSVLPLQRGTVNELAAVPIEVAVGPATAGNTEIRLLSDNLRGWFSTKGKALEAEAVAFLTEHLGQRTPQQLLAIRAEGKASIVELDVEVAPLALADLSKRELTLDERPPPRGLDDQPEPKEDEEDDEEEEDDWSGDTKKKNKTKKTAKKLVVPTPTLDRLGVKWHQLAQEKSFPPTFGRDAVVGQVLTHLDRKDPDPLVLIGPAGVGKTAVLQEVVRRLLARTAAPQAGQRVFHLDGSRLIAGGGFFGEWEKQTLDAFAEAREANAIVYLGRLIDLLDAGRHAHSDNNVAQLILPMLAAREVRVVAEASPAEWARLNDRNQSFARVFAPLVLDEPSASDAALILRQIAEAEARERKATVEPAALDEVRSLVRRFRPEGSPLGNGIAFLRRLIDSIDDGGTLTRFEVIRRFSIESGVPEELLRDDLPLRVEDVRDFLAARVMGQNDAVERVARVVPVLKANLADPSKPVATLLFAGPTGVGKTELSKALAERVFGSKGRLVRLDMGEYSGRDALSRLVGDAGNEGFLTNAVRRQPFSVVLLDEIEKAHPAVFDALLSVLGEGRLTDGNGRTADFRSSVLIMTSNLGAQTHRPNVGFGGAPSSTDVRAHFLGEIRRFFRPEFFNRIDDVVLFSPLNRENLGAIVERELTKVSHRAGFKRLGVGLTLDAEVRQSLADWGHEPKYGARPLKRAIERKLVVPAAAHLASHLPPSASYLQVRRDSDELSFALTPAAKGSEGSAASELLAVCDRAASLRAEIRAWHRAPLMRLLLDDQRLFERLSKQTSFWADRGLAEFQARRAALAKDLDESFLRLRAQVEAVEELAFEAWATREPHSVQELNASLETGNSAFEPLTERLYASRLAQVDAATLMLVPGKHGLKWARWLADGYVTWAQTRGLRCARFVLVPGFRRSEPPPKPRKTVSADELERTIQQKGLGAAAALYRGKHGGTLEAAMKAVAEIKRRLEAPPPEERHEWTEGGYEEGAEAIALQLVGPMVPGLLASEHGLHRIYSEGESFEVKVRFVPQALKKLEQGEALEALLPSAEIRRIWPTRRGQEFGLLRDQRTETEHRVSGAFELGPILAAYIRHIVFGSEVSSWS